MKKFITNLILFSTLILSVSCTQTPSNSSYQQPIDETTIDSVTQADSIADMQSSPVVVDDSEIPSAPIYNFNILLEMFLDPIYEDGYIIFSDTFIYAYGQSGELPDGSNSIFYHDEPITISNCDDLFKYDFNEIVNITSSDRNILAMRKRTCILVDEVTHGTNILAKDGDYENLEFPVPPQEQMNRIAKVLPLWSSQEPNTHKTCSQDIDSQTIFCTDGEEDGYILYLTQVAQVDDTEYYYTHREIGRMFLYYLVRVDSDTIEFELVY